MFRSKVIVHFKAGASLNFRLARLTSVVYIHVDTWWESIQFKQPSQRSIIRIQPGVTDHSLYIGVGFCASGYCLVLLVRSVGAWGYGDRSAFTFMSKQGD